MKAQGDFIFTQHIPKLLTADTPCCCWNPLMLHCRVNIPACNTGWLNVPNTCIKSAFAVTSSFSARFQTCWHLWKWSELKIRGFLTNPICHLSKWSWIPACSDGLYTSTSERIMSRNVTEAVHRFHFLLLILRKLSLELLYSQECREKICEQLLGWIVEMSCCWLVLQSQF